MNSHGVLRVWRGSPRWPYVVLALLALPFVGAAYQDAGIIFGAIYAAVAFVGIIQAIWPTGLGWAVLFLTIGFYVAIGFRGFDILAQGPTITLVLSLVASSFWVLRPWKAWPGRPH